MKKCRKPVAALLVFCMCISLAGILSGIPSIEAEAKEPVYVLTQAKFPDGGEAFSYNMKGLVTERHYIASGREEHVGYVYDPKSNGMTDMIFKSGPETAMYHYECDEKGNRLSCTSNLFGNTVIRYEYDEKHRLTKETWVVNGIENWMNGTYTYADGFLISSYSEKYIDGYSDNSQLLVYDKRGNLNHVLYGDSERKYVNSYKNGRLTARVDSNGSLTTYTYKKIMVDKKLVDRINVQQWRIRNAILPGHLE